MNCPKGDPGALERGRAVYNARCYFCHGYDGDAKTEAARMLDPQPRDFTGSPDLDRSRVLRALEEGRPGTAMRPFAGLLAPEEMADVAAFVTGTFVACAARNTEYHTPENGWPDHRERYRAALPFAAGSLPVDVEEAVLTPAERLGLVLFRSACISCHEGRGARPRPLRLRSDESEIADALMWSGREGEEAGGYGARSIHDLPPEIPNLTREEAEGARLYATACAECHAADGSGRNWVGRFLQPGPPDFTGPAFAAAFDARRFAKGTLEPRPGTAMPGFAGVLQESDVAAIAAYVRRAFFGATAKPAAR